MFTTTTGLVFLSVLVGSILSVAVNAFVTRYRGDCWSTPIIQMLTAPGCLIALCVLAPLSVPYFALYPERHATIWDFEGTREQKQAMEEYRQECAKRGFMRRIAEAVGIRKHSRPDLPEILSRDQESRLTNW